MDEFTIDSLTAALESMFGEEDDGLHPAQRQNFKAPNIRLEDVYPTDPLEQRYNEVRDRQMENGEFDAYLMTLLMELPMMGNEIFAPSGTPRGYPGTRRNTSMDGDY